MRMVKSMKALYWKFLRRIERLRVYVDYYRLRAMRRFSFGARGDVRIVGYHVSYADLDQLIKLYEDVYISRDYRCDLGSRPVIVDAGGNIGLATLFFKQQYPDSRIIAFEPNPDSFALFQKNLEQNGISGVELHNAALGSDEGTISLFLSTDMPGADIGASAIKAHVEYFHSEKGETVEIQVPSVRLSRFVGDGLDLLKLDVEGSEARVIDELGDFLGRVKNVIMEYHYHFTYPDNPLSTITARMENASHLYRIIPDGLSRELNKELTYIIRSARVPSST
jgi:FkbM family methyltransferase